MYTVQCNRHILTAVNFHNCYTDDDGCNVETCLLKLKKVALFLKIILITFYLRCEDIVRRKLMLVSVGREAPPLRCPGLNSGRNNATFGLG